MTGNKRVTIRLPENLVKEAEEFGQKKSHVSFSETVRSLLVAGLESEKKHTKGG